jgi:Ser/Thr protein kinase RdoA (MazF antagonist)
VSLVPPPPRTPGEITVAWLNHVLGAAGVTGDAVVAQATVEAIGDLGGVNGETHRVRLAYAAGVRPPPLAPRTLVAKFPAERAGARGVATFQRWYEREVSFYATLASERAIRTPRCYAASIDPTGDYVLLLEDLWPRAQGDQIAGCSVDDARAALEAIAGVHARWWNAAPPVTDALPETTVGLDRAERVAGALARVWERTRDLVPLPAAVAARLPALVEGYVPLLRHMAAGPVTVVHGDYRLDNLVFDPHAPRRDYVTAIDWQFACRCRGMYDVGYFIGLDLDPALRRAHERELVAGYLVALRARGVEGYGDEEAWDDYRRALLLGFAVFLIGAAGEQPNARMARVHEVGLQRLGAAIAETRALDLLDRYDV